MKILWLTNVPMPDAAKTMFHEEIVTGGWMAALSQSLSRAEAVELAIAFPRTGLAALQEYHDGRIRHYAVPRKTAAGYDASMERPFRELVGKFHPDIIHLHGTEFAHGLALMNACPKEKYVVSIQGLVGIYAQHYYAALPPEVINPRTVRGLIRPNGYRRGRESFRQRAITERQILLGTRHVIGRTEWDRACSRQINPAAQYHFCNESLRNAFYEHSWNLAAAEKYSLFVSQGNYPIKGLHFVLQALPEIRRRFPAARLYVAGDDITRTASLSERLKISHYGLYLKQLIKDNGLAGHVTFTGPLDEDRMCKRFLQAHVFVSASSVENSPNSLGEAMLLGVPCVASDVGGVIDMLTHKEDGFLYPYDAPYLLAHYVCEIFADEKIAGMLSRNARQRAAKTHDREKNVARLLDIYQELLS
jgi:Glycosyltransferase